MKTRREARSWVAGAVLLALFTPASHAADPAVWHIKVVHPEGRLLDVKSLPQVRGSTK